MGDLICCCARNREHADLIFSKTAHLNFQRAILSCRSLKQQIDHACIASYNILPLIPTAKPVYELQTNREEIGGLPDGGLVAIDWIGEKSPLTPSCVVLFFPGLGTTSKTGFTAMAAHYMAEHPELFMPEVPAIGVVVMQGFDGLPLKTTKLPGTALVSTDDAGHVIEHVASKFGVKIVVIGISIGGAFVTHWAGKFPISCKKSNVVGGVIVAHGLDVYKSAKACEAYMPNQHILSCFQNNLQLSPPDMDLLAKFPDFHMEKLTAARSVREWDEAMLPLYGFSDYESMLDASDTGQLLHQLPVPFVFVSADNDPVAPATRLIDEGRIQEIVPNCAIVRTKRGSHLAWWEGSCSNLEQRWILMLLTEVTAALANLPHES